MRQSRSSDAGQRARNIPVENPDVADPLRKGPLDMCPICDAIAGGPIRPGITGAEQMIPKRADGKIQVAMLLVDRMMDLMILRRHDDPAADPPEAPGQLAVLERGDHLIDNEKRCEQASRWHLHQKER